MAANEKNHAYWQGYRDARIDAFMFLADKAREFALSIDDCPYQESDIRERYLAGYLKGALSIRDDLAREIAKSDKYER